MHRYTPGKLAFWTLSESWRFGSDDFADFNWAIFRFKHANFQRCNVPPLSFYRVCLTILMKVFPWDRWFSYGCQLIPQLCDVRISNVLRCNESVNVFSNVKFRFFFQMWVFPTLKSGHPPALENHKNTNQNVCNNWSLENLEGKQGSNNTNGRYIFTAWTH